MTGKEAIIEKIRADARQKVNSTLAEGARKAQEAIALARAGVKIYKDRNMSESYAERDEIINRRITVANLDVKKLILKAKVTAIDKAFEEATKEIKADKSRYLELIKRMIKFADDGDTVIISESDKDVITGQFIDECAKNYGKKISLSREYGAFIGGIMLSGDNSDKNLTLEAELSELRGKYESQIAEMLFGE